MLRVWVRVEEYFRVVRVCEVGNVDVCSTPCGHSGHGAQDVLLKQTEQTPPHLRVGELLVYNLNCHGIQFLGNFQYSCWPPGDIGKSACQATGSQRPLLPSVPAQHA